MPKSEGEGLYIRQIFTPLPADAGASKLKLSHGVCGYDAGARTLPRSLNAPANSHYPSSLYNAMHQDKDNKDYKDKVFSQEVPLLAHSKYQKLECHTPGRRPEPSVCLRANCSISTTSQCKTSQLSLCKSRHTDQDQGVCTGPGSVHRTRVCVTFLHAFTVAGFPFRQNQSCAKTASFTNGYVIYGVIRTPSYCRIWCFLRFTP